MVKFDLRFLGVGSAFSKIHYNNNILLTINNKNYLLDCGVTAMKAIHDLGLELKDIEGIIISHIHADHTGGLEEVGFMSRFVLKKKLKLFIPDELVTLLWENTLSGGMKDDEINDNLTLEDYFNVETYSDLSKLVVSDLEILPIKTIHVSSKKPSYSFIFDDRVFFSADILFDEDLLKEFSDFEAIFHDVQFFKGGVHCSLEELETLPEEIRLKTYLMHYGDNYADFIERVKSSKMRFVLQGETFNF